MRWTALKWAEMRWFSNFTAQKLYMNHTKKCAEMFWKAVDFWKKFIQNSARLEVFSNGFQQFLGTTSWALTIQIALLITIKLFWRNCAKRCWNAINEYKKRADISAQFLFNLGSFVPILFFIENQMRGRNSGIVSAVELIAFYRKEGFESQSAHFCEKFLGWFFLKFNRGTQRFSYIIFSHNWDFHNNHYRWPRDLQVVTT